MLQQRDNTNQNIEGRILLNDAPAEHQQWQSKVTVGLAIGGETQTFFTVEGISIRVEGVAHYWG